MRTINGLWCQVRPLVLSVAILLWSVGWIPTVGAAVEDIECGSLENAFGPFDYRTATAFNKKLVEGPHFVDQNAAVMQGKLNARGNHVMDDLHYTLRVFPNHHGALMAIDRLGRMTKTEKPFHRAYKLECYYLRGIRMAKDDPMVHYLYGLYLQHRGRKTDARQMIEKSVELFEANEDGMSPNVLYNLGLTYFEFGAYDQAAIYARRAAEGNFTLPGLKNKLKSVGRWQEPQAPLKSVEVAPPASAKMQEENSQTAE